MAAKVMQYGMNKPIRVQLPDAYFDILFAVAEMQGRTVEDLAAERLKQIIIEDVVFDERYCCELITKGWKEDLKDDSYFKDVCG